MIHAKFKPILLIALMLMLALIFVGCEAAEKTDGPLVDIINDGDNQVNIDHTTKDIAIDKVVTSMENLQKRIGTADVGEGGYYLGFDFHINTENRSNFILKLKAHLFTYPYEDEDGRINPEALARHNQIIKKSTLLIEWYDGITNSMLIGFYYDPVRSNPNDPGNTLYLNIQGQKRWFEDFGDTVLFQQIIRLITHLDINRILDSAGAGGEKGTSAIRQLLSMAVTNNYKLVVNHNEETKKDITSVNFTNVGLDVIRGNISELIQKIFSAYQDKIDPLTLKYLGFKFSVLGQTQLQTLSTNALFFIEPDTDGILDLLTGAELNFFGASMMSGASVPFTADFAFFYGAAPPEPIELDKKFYKYFDYGKYEFEGNLYIPSAQLNMDALIRTKLNNYDNPSNIFFSEFRDIANGSLLIGAYYKNELAYLDIEGLQHLYGGVHLEDIGLPKIFIEGWDLSKLMLGLKNFFNDTVTKAVDNLLAPKDDSPSNNLKEVIMEKMASTEKDPNDPTTKNTVMIRIDHELIKNVLREGGYGDYTTRDIINILNAQLPITMDEIATILGITSAEVLIEKIWFMITLDVDTNQITIQMFSDIGLPAGTPSVLQLQLDLVPVKFGEDMPIADLKFDNFKPLLPIYTYSAEMHGQFIFSLGEVVDFSELLSSFMDDVSGYNTKYILPTGTKLDFTLAYDQYIREQRLQTQPGGDRDGAWTRSSRNAFNLNVYIKGNTVEENVTLFNIYANDVSFKSTVDGETEEERLERLGYIWIDLVCLRTADNPRGIPKFKIREDYWLQSVNRYMNSTGASDSIGTMLNPDVSLSITTIISALMEDSYIQFQPEQIEITTSNETVQNIFNVDQLIGNIAAQIGLVQRVFGLENIEDDFAHYTVGEFKDITADGPYTTKLHSTIDVTFNFREYDRSKIKVTKDITSWSEYKKLVDENIILARRWDETVPMLFKYEPDSVKVRDEASEYFPMIYGPIYENEYSPLIQRFMGAQRSYKITMTGSANSRKLITALANKDWTYLDMDSVKSEYIILDEDLEFYREAADETDEALVKKYLLDLYGVTLNNSRLIPHYRLEPLEPKPAKLDVRVGLTTPGIVSYASDIKIDWSKVTVQGGEYITEAVIAEGMMGETHFPVHIVITNREIDTTDSKGMQRLPSYVNVLADENSSERTRAPVVNEVTVNIFDYAWEKALYLKQFFNPIGLSGAEYDAARRKADLDFVSYYFGKKEVIIKFVDLDSTVTDFRDTPNFVASSAVAEGMNSGYLEWSFDKYIPDENYVETDIGVNAGETYLHANFKGRIVALKVIVESRTVIGVKFDGEDDINVYTVDVLDESTHAIPLYPYIVFAETEADGMQNLTMRLYNAQYDVYAPMQWLYSVANNLNINGTDQPFLGSTSKITSAFIDLYRSLDVAKWAFDDRSPLVQVTVECPPKEVVPLGERIGQDYIPKVVDNVYENMKYNASGDAQWQAVVPVSMTPSKAIMQTYLNKGSLDKYYGYYFVDPFDSSTAVLPTSLRVYFYRKNDTDERYAYYRDYSNAPGRETVKWKLDAPHLASCLPGCTENHALIEKDAQGNYVLKVNSNTEIPRDLKLIALVGNDIVGYIEVEFCVKILSSKYTDIVFLDDGGNVVAAQKTANQDEFIMEVSTFKGFKLPATYEVTFGEDDIRTYTASWKGKNGSTGAYDVAVENIKFNPGAVVYLSTSMVGKNGVTLTVILIVSVINEELTAISFPFMPEISTDGYTFTPVDITVQLSTKNMMIINVPIAADARIKYVRLINSNVVSFTLFDFINYIFGGAILTLETRAGLDFITENIAKDLSIYNLEGILNVADVLRNKSGGTINTTYTMRVGQGAGAYDLTVRFEFINGLMPQSTGDEVIEIIPYDRSGNAIFGAQGYVLGDRISATVTASDQTKTGNPLVAIEYGANAAGGRLDRWYVEYSSISAIIKTGTFITVIPSEVLYAQSGDFTVTVSALTPEGFRIRRSLTFVNVRFASQYDSVTTVSSDLFSIKQGVITIEDLYAFYPLNNYLSNTTYIPKTVRRTLTADYAITINNIQWVISENWFTTLSAVNYKGLADRVLFATATILGWKEITLDSEGREVAVWHNRETISLYIKIELAEVYALPLESSLGLFTDFKDITVNALSPAVDRQRISDLFNANISAGAFNYREFIINVDAYDNSNYRGTFVLPINLVIQYISGLTHTFSSMRFSYRGIAISSVPYNIEGITWLRDASTGEYYLSAGGARVDRMAGDDANNITVTANLGAGQVIAIRLHFYNKTVSYVAPVISYNDLEIRSAITAVLSDDISALKTSVYGKINAARLAEELNYVMKAIITARDILDVQTIIEEIRRLFYSDTPEIIENKIGEGFIQDMLAEILNRKLTPYKASEIINGTVDGVIKTSYNYAAGIINAKYDANITRVINSITALGLAAVKNIEGADFEYVAGEVAAFYSDIFASSLLDSVNNKIADYVLPVIMGAIGELSAEESYYVAGLKNSVLAEINHLRILKDIENYKVKCLGGKSTGMSMYEWINVCIEKEFTRGLNAVLNSTQYSADYQLAVENALKARKLEVDLHNALIISVYNYMDALFAGLSAIADPTARKQTAWSDALSAPDAAIRAFINEFNTGVYGNLSNEDKWDMLWTNINNEIDESIPVERNMSEDIIRRYFEKLFAYRDDDALIETAVRSVIKKNLASYVKTINDAVLAGLSLTTGSRLSSAVSYAVSTALDNIIIEGILIHSMQRAIALNDGRVNQNAAEGIYIIDPYGNYIGVPSKIRMVFDSGNGGYDHITSADWHKPVGWSTTQNPYAGVNYQGNEKTDWDAKSSAWKQLDGDIDLNAPADVVTVSDDYDLLRSTRNNLRNSFTSFVSNGGTEISEALKIRLWARLSSAASPSDYSARAAALKALIAGWNSFATEAARINELLKIDEAGLTTAEAKALLELIYILSGSNSPAPSGRSIEPSELFDLIMALITYDAFGSAEYTLFINMLETEASGISPDNKRLLLNASGEIRYLCDGLDAGLSAVYRILINKTHKVLAGDFYRLTEVIASLPQSGAVFTAIYNKARASLSGSDSSADNIRKAAFDAFFAIFLWENMKEAIVDPASQALWNGVILPALDRRFIAAKWNDFTSAAVSYGVRTQNLSLVVKVENRAVAPMSFTVIDPAVYTKETYAVNGETRYIDAKYHVTDPFAARISDFPDDIYYQGSVPAVLTGYNDMKIVWSANDLSISYRGTLSVDKTTGLMGTLVTGYIKNSRVGQPVTLRLIVDAWTYNETSGSGLKHYAGGGENPDIDNYLPTDVNVAPEQYVSNSGAYNLMNPINFVFSKLVNYSLEDVYLVTFRRTSYTFNGGVEGTKTDYINVLFYPETSILLAASTDDAMQEIIDIRSNYILYWDKTALSQALNNGGAYTGNFSLGNVHKASFMKNGAAKYEYEETYIERLNASGLTEDDLYEWYVSMGETTNARTLARTMYNSLFGLTGVASIVVNPFDPSLPLTVDAKGILNQALNVALGNVRVLWNKELSSAKADLIGYIMYMYPMFSYADAEAAAMNMLININRSPAEQQSLINSITSWYISKWMIDYGITLPSDPGEAWEVMYTKMAATSPATLIKMQLLASAMTSQYGNRGGETLEGYWTDLKDGYYNVRNANSMTFANDSARAQAYDALFLEGSGVPGTVTAPLRQLRSRLMAQYQNDITASARAYDYYADYIRWSQLMGRMQSLQDKAAYMRLLDIQRGYQANESVFEQYSNSWTELTGILSAGDLQKTEGWNRVYNYVKLKETIPVLGEKEKAIAWDSEINASVGELYTQLSEILAYATAISPSTAAAKSAAYNIYIRSGAWDMLYSDVYQVTALKNELDAILAAHSGAGSTTLQRQAASYDALLDALSGAPSGLSANLLALRPYANAAAATINNYLCYFELKARASAAELTFLTTVIEPNHLEVNEFKRYSSCWLDVRSTLGAGITTMSDSQKAAEWDIVFANKPALRLELSEVLTVCETAENALVKRKAAAYDLYMKSKKWQELKGRYTSGSALLNELTALEAQVASEGVTSVLYLRYAICWDRFGAEFTRETVASLDRLLASAAYANSLLKGNEITAAAWDLWLKGKTYEKWLEQVAKGYLMIDESYDIDSYIKNLTGGIDGGRQVTLMLQLTEGGYIYTQTFKVRMVYLDMNPVAYRNSNNFNIAGMSMDNGKVVEINSFTGFIKVNYKLVNDGTGKNDYTGKTNPYDNNQSQLLQDLINAYTYTNLGRDAEMVQGTPTEVYKVLFTDVVWDIPANVKSGDTVRSKSFTVNGKTYYSNMLSMTIL